MTTEGSNDPHDSEFNVVARWTADELAGRDATSVFAGASRGSGSPAALAWLAESLGFRAGLRLLDVGAGLGGPAAWAAERYGVWPVAVEPMTEADKGAARLFDHAIVAASARDLPVRSASFEVAWTLGVLDTVARPVDVLTEIRRSLVPDGRLGILAYVAVEPIDPEDAPEGNHFQSPGELLDDLTTAGFHVVDQVGSGELPKAPLDWQLRQDRLDERLAERHGDDPRWREAREQEEAFAGLLASGRLEARLLHALSV